MAGKRFYEKQLVEVEKCLVPDSLLSSREKKGAHAALLNKKREFLNCQLEYVKLVNLLGTNSVVFEVNSTSTDSDSDISTDEEGDSDHCAGWSFM